MSRTQARAKINNATVIWLWPALLVAMTLSLSTVPASAQTRGVSLPIQSTASTPPPLSREDVEAWADGLLPYAIKQGDIAGGVVSVVKDGRVLFKKGYGYADVAFSRPMDADSTIIRPGSISKLFIWTAVMQLVEQRRLDLDTDINRYLDFHVPAYAGQPMTLRNIVTHTTGFEESFKDIMGRYPPRDLGTYIKTHTPARIYPPGKVPAYSNYGAALAAYIVERVSGERFESYTARHIFVPLDMTRSTFAQPVPAAWGPQMSHGYSRASEPSGYYEFIGPFPAGGLNSTAVDMAKFMIAHLRNGQFGASQILSEETAIAMHAPQNRVFPSLNAMAVGFYETTRNGHRSIAHNGGTQFFHSDLHLLLDDGVGIFISVNSAGNDEAATKIHNALFNGFMDRYFPEREAARQSSVPPPTARDHGRLTAGYWESSRRSAGSWLSLAGLFSPMAISNHDDGSVSLPFPGRGTVRWHEIGPYLWQSDDGKDKMQAVTQAGKPVMIGFSAAPPAAFLPVPWWRSPGWVLPALAAALSLLLAHGLALPFSALVRKVYRVGHITPALGKLHHRSAKLLSLALVVCAIAYPALLALFSGDLTNMSARTDMIVYSLEAATLVLLTAATGFALWAAMRTWRLQLGWGRKVLTVAKLCALGVLWWVATAFHLINLSTHY